MNVEVNDANELRVEEELIRFEDLNDVLHRRLVSKRFNTIHYYSGKRLLDLDKQVSEVLRHFADHNTIELKFLQAIGFELDANGNFHFQGNIEPPSNFSE
ncbi:hypothetical protein SH449x_000425 [Pirellulaceae bacterium SH449]